MKLHTLGPSHYCEKARWGLSLLGFSFDEVSYPPLIHVPYVRAAGGSSTPVLVTPELTLTDSTDILKWANTKRSQGLDLYPEALAAEIEVWEQLCNHRLGPAVRRFSYYWLLPHREVVLPCLTSNASATHAALTSVAFVPIRALMRTSMAIDEQGAQRSKKCIDEVLQKIIQDRYAAGHSYLVGQQFTAADLTFAALMAPLAFVQGYGAHLPDFESLPHAVREAFKPYRDHPAAQRVRELYQEFRLAPC